MDIRIKSIKLLNFKGARTLSLEFNGENRTLSGANATGKSTVFDAFTWTLFGKDSRGATQFEIKTLSATGEVIARIPHAVTVELLVDGRAVTLRREYEEKWVKTRGETEETFRGHEVNRFWNDVPCTAAEYDAKVAELCEESMFRLITNPAYFNTLGDPEKMRLLNMLEGNTTDDQFMASNPEFAAFLRVLDGKTLDEYRRELSAKIHATNTEIATLHTRLDEVNHNMPEAEDWSAIETEIQRCNFEIQRCKDLHGDVVRRTEEQGAERMRIQGEINAENMRIQARENAIREEVNADYYAKSATKRELQGQLDGARQELGGVGRNIDTLTARRQSLTVRMETLTTEYRTIHAETFTFDPARGICQTCKQPLPDADVDGMRATMEANFNTNKAARLQSNIDDGKNVQAEIKGIDELLAQHTANRTTIETRIAEIEANSALASNIAPADPSARIGADPEIAAARAKIAEYRQTIDALSTTESEVDYRAQEREWTDKKSALERRLYVRTTIETARGRITEIENGIKSNGQRLLSLQGDEQMIRDIQKAKALYVESRINSMFQIVRFRMIDPQVNGGERQVCETTVDGVPYASLNNAARINAGLDIINAFCRYNGITAPVFVDNAEAVNELIPMASQMISLVVSNDKTLTLK